MGFLEETAVVVDFLWSTSKLSVSDFPLWIKGAMKHEMAIDKITDEKRNSEFKRNKDTNR